jgi:hypothetical protein
VTVGRLKHRSAHLLPVITIKRESFLELPRRAGIAEQGRSRRWIGNASTFSPPNGQQSGCNTMKNGNTDQRC